MAIVGRYILTPEIFEALEGSRPGANGEIQLTDAIQQLMISQVIYACEFQGEWYDVGDKFGYIRATINQALEREELYEPLRDYIKKLAAELK